MVSTWWIYGCVQKTLLQHRMIDRCTRRRMDERIQQEYDYYKVMDEKLRKVCFYAKVVRRIHDGSDHKGVLPKIRLR